MALPTENVSSMVEEFMTNNKKMVKRICTQDLDYLTNLNFAVHFSECTNLADWFIFIKDEYTNKIAKLSDQEKGDFVSYILDLIKSYLTQCREHIQTKVQTYNQRYAEYCELESFDRIDFENNVVLVDFAPTRLLNRLDEFIGKVMADIADSQCRHAFIASGRRLAKLFWAVMKNTQSTASFVAIYTDLLGSFKDGNMDDCEQYLPRVFANPLLKRLESYNIV
ncbi:hypothetical protein H4219_005755 [Mycoemilia scoparia]|uniref:Uncharacterized protein n=1 Tax=Mycoemilia scoparia TaxID=417184 RepID=A0A9W7ZMT2_9FUNG|nr:hypothetical protein H4219_005755 [Mycoemilia scoparia]